MAAQRTSRPTPGAETPPTVHDGPTPKHVQLREILRGLATGELRPGSPMPSERELALQHGISRLTVREAIGQLVAEGVLVRVRGRGTFTSGPRRALLPEPIATAGMPDRARVTVLASAETAPPANAAATLRLVPEQPAYRVVRLIEDERAPRSVERGWYHPGIVPGLLRTDLTTPLDALFVRNYRIPFEREIHTVRAENADPDIARLLGTRAGSPVLVFRSVSTTRGQPFEDATSWYRGDRHQLALHPDHNSAQHAPQQASPGGTE